ncbi:MAG: DUF6245 family protein, partial [Pseudonocardiaceae bacterium]
TMAEHAEEAARLGAGPNAYRFRLVNALLGAVQTEVILSDMTGEQMSAACRQQFVTAGVAGDPAGRWGSCCGRRCGCGPVGKARVIKYKRRPSRWSAGACLDAGAGQDGRRVRP